MTAAPELLLIGAVAAVGVLHTVVPDHWVPITLVARQQGWTKREVARAAFVAGTGHAVSTLIIGLLVWVAGVAFATRFGNLVSTISSVALIAFGGWIAATSLRDLRSGHGHGHSHGPGGHEHHRSHDHGEPNGFHGPEFARIGADNARLHAARDDVDDVLYAPSRGGTTVLGKHAHVHRHGSSSVHAHLHDHGPDTWHDATMFDSSEPPPHEHDHKRSLRTSLLLILGSSPMVEGIPAFFAAGKFGIGLIIVMGIVFAVSTIATYVALCVISVTGLQRVSLGPLERYGEVLSGAFIALVGFVFVIFPIL